MRLIKFIPGLLAIDVPALAANHGQCLNQGVVGKDRTPTKSSRLSRVATLTGNPWFYVHRAQM
jgi:hypothetical protein